MITSYLLGVFVGAAVGAALAIAWAARQISRSNPEVCENAINGLEVNPAGGGATIDWGAGNEKIGRWILTRLAVSGYLNAGDMKVGKMAQPMLCAGGCGMRTKTFSALCLEWLKGCSCAPSGDPAECEECTTALLDAIKRRGRELRIVDGSHRRSECADSPKPRSGNDLQP